MSNIDSINSKDLFSDPLLLSPFLLKVHLFDRTQLKDTVFSFTTQIIFGEIIRDRRNLLSHLVIVLENLQTPSTNYEPLTVGTVGRS